MTSEVVRTGKGLVITTDGFDRKFGMYDLGVVKGEAVLPSDAEVFEDDLGRKCVQYQGEAWTLSEAVSAASRGEIPGATFTRNEG